MKRRLWVNILITSLVTLFVISGIITPAVAENEVTERAAEDKTPFDVAAKSAILIDAATGTVLYAKNADEPLPPASVTKVMTLLLVMEAIDEGKISLTDTVTVSDYAASMGGSQVYLEPGEEMTVEELLKCVIIASANDGAMALAELVAGSEAEFVSMMNERAGELGMSATHFENPTGLDDDVTDHRISARDIATVSRELIRYEKILEYSSIWMDSIRNGEFGLTNTNRLIRFYSGATGLKTGSTANAGFCISATAEREGMHLIAVIMGSATRDERNEAAKALLDFGFANYCIYTAEGAAAGDVPVKGAAVRHIETLYDGVTLLLPKGKNKGVTVEIKLQDFVSAPVQKGDVVGSAVFVRDGETLHECDVTAAEGAERVGFFDVLRTVLSAFAMG